MMTEPNWDDPRIAPHLQSIADESFLNLQELALKFGLPVLPDFPPRFRWPLSQIDSNLANEYKGLIIQLLGKLMGPTT